MTDSERDDHYDSEKDEDAPPLRGSLPIRLHQQKHAPGLLVAYMMHSLRHEITHAIIEHMILQ
jgi:hypothetical protein